MTDARNLGFSPQRLARIDAFLQRRYIDSGRLPGASLMITRRGEIAHFACLGAADVARGVRVAGDTLFRIYSMTKPLTSVALMMLVEEGAIALDDPVEKYIPAWRDLGVFVAGFPPDFQTRRPDRSMQVVDLLRHTAGLTYGFQNRTNVDAAYRQAGVGEIVVRLTLEETIERLAGLPLEFSPGEAWNYSVATDVCGYLVQVVSGVAFPDLLRSRILGPLDMRDTDFQVAPGQGGRLAACYTRAADGALTLQDDPVTSRYLAAPVFYSGGGGLVSTAGDYMKFCKMLLAGGRAGGQRLISRKTLDLMRANHLPGGRDLTQMSRSLFSEATNAGVGFGLGFAVSLDPAKALLAGSVGECYWGGAAGTAFWIDPVEDIAVVFMTQLMPSTTWPIRRELRTLVYAALDD